METSRVLGCEVWVMSRIDLDVGEGAFIRTPVGDRYQLVWDAISGRLTLMLVEVGSPGTHTTALALTPRAANSIEIRPRRRED